MRLAVATTVALSTACSPKPASIEWLKPLPDMLLSSQPLLLPKYVVKDASGATLAEGVQVTVTALPDDVMKLEGGRLVAVSNGQAAITAAIAGKPLKAEHWVKVRMVKRVEIECEPSCSVRVGEALKARAIGYTDTERFSDLCVPEVLGQGFETLAPGQFRATAPGGAKLKCGGAEVALYANPRVDKLEVKCPTPASIETCFIDRGARVKLTVAASGGGVAALDPKVTWTSSKPGIATVVNGELVAEGTGTAELTAAVDGATAKLTVQLVQPTKLGCTGKPGRFKYTFLEPKQRYQSRARGITVECELELSEACMEANLAKTPEPSAEQATEVFESCCCQVTLAQVAPPKVETPRRRTRRGYFE